MTSQQIILHSFADERCQLLAWCTTSAREYKIQLTMQMLAYLTVLCATDMTWLTSLCGEQCRRDGRQVRISGDFQSQRS